MLILKKRIIALSFLSLLTSNSWAITQDGAVGTTSTGYIDSSFESSRLVKISGLQDISFNINPLQQTVPPSNPITICLYSSTGKASVTADTNTTVDRINHRATLESPTASIAFALTIDNIDMFTSVPPVFDSSVSTTDCSDNQGKHNLVVSLLQTPTLAGTYTATVSLTISASDE